MSCEPIDLAAVSGTTIIITNWGEGFSSRIAANRLPRRIRAYKEAQKKRSKRRDAWYDKGSD